MGDGSSGEINYQFKPKNLFHKILAEMNPIHPTVFYSSKKNTEKSLNNLKQNLIDPFIGKVRKYSHLDNPKILDAGAGTGNEAKIMKDAGIDTTILDFSREGLLHSDFEKKIQANVLTMPFQGNTFSGIFSKDMITHIPPDKIAAFFNELNRICISNGVISLVYADGMVNKLGMRQYQHKSAFIIQEAERLGLKLIEQAAYKPEIEDWYFPLKVKRVVLSFLKK